MTAPAVTIGLVAYNQEKYVRAAIEGALGQDFSPLEIILSDDCSSDGTFAIMEEMVAAYRGPHQVIARREPVNVGTVQHVINVSRAARGGLVVIAAGDDISYPDRASALHAAWKESGAAALASRHDEIDEAGAMLRRDVSFPPSKITQIMFADEPQAQRVDGMIQTVPGFCAAYPRSFWADLPDPPVKLLVEDGIASALINLRGGTIHRIPRSLIAYRLLDTSLTVRSAGLSVDEIRDRERRIDRHASGLEAEVDYTVDQIQREGIAIAPLTLSWLNKARNHGRVIANFWAASAMSRLGRLAAIRSRNDATFLVPRLMGFRMFVVIRTIIEKYRAHRALPHLRED